MDMSITNISSDTLIPIEQHFRLSAGPGAGKTHWLISHIKNVLHQSKRLQNTRRIACITYTNVAVETILERLGTSTNQVEVSTIHSFLYKHIVKPYVSFIATDYNLDVRKIDGHDDVVLSNYSFLKDWKNRTGQQRIRENDQVIDAIRAARWKFTSGGLVVKPDYPRKINGYAIKNDSYYEYKKMAWEKGVLHHDDVLFFSYQLVNQFPFILQVLRAKFPYFFVDEFQDTNPIQAKILGKIGLEETIVGVIGDKAQSIYGFQGADPSKFSDFNLPNLIDYQINDNRRSTNQIISILNTIRTDIHQCGVKNEDGEKPIIFAGDMNVALREAQKRCSNEVVHSLSRDNITSNAMKREMNKDIPSEDLLQRLNITDSNRDRKKLLIACIKATELAREKRFKEAIKELERIFKDKSDKNKGRKKALQIILLLLQQYDEIKKLSLFDFHSFVKEHINSKIPNVRRQTRPTNIQTFYENYTYQQLAVCVKIKEDISLHRTIHKAKGDEFDNTLLILKNENDIEFLLTPDLENKEEHRIYYVAVSRAKKQLFISVPRILDVKKSKLNSLFDIIEN